MQRTAELLKLTKTDIAGFWKIFRAFDDDRKGVITIKDFFDKIIHEKRNILGNAIFELVDVEDAEKLEFGEFIQAVCTYCSFAEDEILKFCFFIFDRDKNGYIDQDELRYFIETIHDNVIKGNVQAALQSLKLNKDGKFDYREFETLNKDYPSILYPCMRVQQNMMQNIMGEKWWKSKKLTMTAEAWERRDADNKAIDRAFKKFEKARQNNIKKEMGTLQYYFRAEKRSAFDQKYPPKTKEDIREQIQIEASMKADKEAGNMAAGRQDQIHPEAEGEKGQESKPEAES